MYTLVGKFTGTDGKRHSVTAKTGSSNPQDLQYQHAKRRIAKAVVDSPYSDENTAVNFAIKGSSKKQPAPPITRTKILPDGTRLNVAFHGTPRKGSK